jgi:hypothetical protein
MGEERFPFDTPSPWVQDTGLVDAADLPLADNDGVVGRSLSTPEPRPVGQSLRGILILAPARRQYFARGVSAGRAGICDKPLHLLEWLNPGHLLHRAIAPRTADRILLSGIRHNKPQLSASTLKPVRTFPLYRQKVLTSPFVLEHLAEITAIDPSIAGGAADEMLGLALGRIVHSSPEDDATGNF